MRLFERSRARWSRLAGRAHDFVSRNFPDGAAVRRDDVAKALVPLLEVHQELNQYLSTNKLKQKYWTRDFCDLVLDRSWDDIAE